MTRELVQHRIDAIVSSSGCRQGINRIGRSFPGRSHKELTWASPVEIALRFALERVQTPNRFGELMVIQ